MVNPSDLEFIQRNLTTAELWSQLEEEAIELAKAASKMARLFGKGKNKPRKTASECAADVVEEHADVALCFMALGWQDKPTRERIMESKAHRWMKEISKNGGG